MKIWFQFIVKHLIFDAWFDPKQNELIWHYSKAFHGRTFLSANAKQKWKCQCSICKCITLWMFRFTNAKSKWKLILLMFFNYKFKVSINKLKLFFNGRFKVSTNKLKYGNVYRPWNDIPFYKCKIKMKVAMSSPWPISQVLFQNGYFYYPWHFNTLQFNINFNIS